MRIVNPTGVSLVSHQGNSLLFTGKQGEQFQISVLADDCIRVQHRPENQSRLNRTWIIVGKDGDMPRSGRSRDDLSPFALPPFEMDTTDDRVSIKTNDLQLQIALGDFHITWSNEENQVFAADLQSRAYPYDHHNNDVYHYMERRPDEHYFGFGERSGLLDKKGRRMRMFNVDAMGYNAESSDPLYKHFPFYITLVPELNIAYGLLYDNLSTTTFDMGCEIDNYYNPFRYYQAEDGDIDYYMIYGPTVADVVQKLSKLTGRMILPPRWSLGYVASAWSPTEMPDAQQQLKKLVDDHAAHDIPCSVYQMSSGYTVMESERTQSGIDVRNDQRFVFNWNKSRVPNPQAMSNYFHQAGIKVAANIKPALLTSHPQFNDVKLFNGFIQSTETNEPELNIFWGGEGAFLDFTNPATFDWWKMQVGENLLAKGIDITWNDNNEYTLWNDDARCHGFGETIRAGLIRPLFSLLMSQSSYEAQQEFLPDERPFLICRSGCIGIQRFAQTWSGDNETSWHTLRYNIPMGLGMSLSNAPNTGHDVGGLVGPMPGPELLVRWVQNGIFHPRFTIHSWNDDASYTNPWMYPETEDLLRSLFKFRYRLIPYLYSLFFAAAESGIPIIRPMVYEFQHDPNCHTESFDFMCGPNLLVASVLEEGARSRAVYLPKIAQDNDGQWCNFHSGEWHSGGKTIQVNAPLEQIPLFVPAGGFLPLGKAMRYVGEQPDDLRQIYVFPHPEQGRGSFTLIEDDGLSLDYQQGGVTEVVLTVDSQPDSVHLDIAFERQGFKLPYEKFEFILPEGDHRDVTASNSIIKTWVDEQNRQHVEVVVNS
ncbi:MAG: glycoside hydrolase family 31 protein [Chloroflexi bacterium]|nr:MAG: glycoside hydrolase family 31 protein [Chloroflexota bacterium]